MVCVTLMKTTKSQLNIKQLNPIIAQRIFSRNNLLYQLKAWIYHLECDRMYFILLYESELRAKLEKQNKTPTFSFVPQLPLSQWPIQK